MHVLFIHKPPLNKAKITFLSDKLKQYGAQTRTDTFVDGVTHICLECDLDSLFNWSLTKKCADAMPAPSILGCPVHYVLPSFIHDLLSNLRIVQPSCEHHWGRTMELSEKNMTMAKFMVAKSSPTSSTFPTSSTSPSSSSPTSSTSSTSSTSPSPSSSPTTPRILTCVQCSKTFLSYVASLEHQCYKCMALSYGYGRTTYDSDDSDVGSFYEIEGLGTVY